MTLHELDEYTEYLCRFDKDVDANMAYFLFLIWRQDIKSFNKYKKSKRNPPITELKFELLLDLGYLEIKVNPHNYEFKNIDVSEKFLKLVAIDEDDAFDELCKYYPKNAIIINNKPNNPINVSRNKGIAMYEKIINNNRLLHNKIIEILIAYTKDYPLIMGIEKFLEIKHWEFMRSHMEVTAKKKDSILKA